MQLSAFVLHNKLQQLWKDLKELLGNVDKMAEGTNDKSLVVVWITALIKEFLKHLL